MTLLFIIYQSSKELFFIDMTNPVTMLSEIRKAAVHENECVARWKVLKGKKKISPEHKHER